jgi:hypothetical protein
MRLLARGEAYATLERPAAGSHMQRAQQMYTCCRSSSGASCEALNKDTRLLAPITQLTDLPSEFRSRKLLRSC